MVIHNYSRKEVRAFFGNCVLFSTSMGIDCTQPSCFDERLFEALHINAGYQGILR